MSSTKSKLKTNDSTVTVSLVFAQSGNDDIRKQIAKMLFNAWIEKEKQAVARK